MKIEELSKFGIDDIYIQKFREQNIHKLYKPQAEILKNNLLSDNLVISIPTAAGKTLLATLAMIKNLSNKKKIIYITPMIALTNEKYSYFKEIFGKKYRVSMSIGDFDSDDPWLKYSDIIVCTIEKLDSLTRHKADWLKEVGLIIVDEVHLINDSRRGPTLEVLLTKMKQLIPESNFISLSATVKNSKELANWLDSKLFVSDFRPTKLHEGVYFDNKITFSKHTYKTTEDMEAEASIMKNTLELKKQCLFFVSSRRNAESLAERLIGVTNSSLKPEDKKQLEKISKEILSVLESPTKQCKRLSNCVLNGTAFHHAGLMKKQKEILETNFRKGLIKVISATPTLAIGVNLPAFRVIIRDFKRFSGFGMNYIPVMEYKQMSGRAGRPEYDSFGESILVAKSEDEKDDLTERFIDGEVEDIKSKLAVEPILRMHTLSLIASDFTRTEQEIIDFFSKTFYSFQYGNDNIINEKIMDIITELEEWEFIERNDKKISPTKLGKRISELYLDPQTAHNFIDSLVIANQKENNYFSFLNCICNSIEMQPKVSVKTKDIESLHNEILLRNEEFLQEIPEEWDYEFDNFIRSFKTSLLFDNWVNEKTDDEILNEFRIAPGEMRSRIKVADWLIYSLQEISNLLGYKKLLTDIKKIRLRLKYGIKAELLPLVKLKGIGRVRARKLYKNNLKTLDSLRKIPIESLQKIIGKKLSTSIKKEVGEKRLLKK